MDPKLLREIIREELAPIKKTQLEHSNLLQEHTNFLQEHSEKLDAITAELHDVHQLADTTLDIVKGRYEKNKKEIDEIKDHLDLPKEPYFGEQP